MEKIVDKMVSPSVRYTKVRHSYKIFRRFHYKWRGVTTDILWLDSDRNFLNEGMELILENEFQKKLNDLHI